MKTDFSDIYEVLVQIVKQAEISCKIDGEISHYHVPAKLITEAANLIEF